jgi:hypothetical protein
MDGDVATGNWKLEKWAVGLPTVWVQRGVLGWAAHFCDCRTLFPFLFLFVQVKFDSWSLCILSGGEQLLGRSVKFET